MKVLRQSITKFIINENQKFT